MFSAAPYTLILKLPPGQNGIAAFEAIVNSFLATLAKKLSWKFCGGGEEKGPGRGKKEGANELTIQRELLRSVLLEGLAALENERAENERAEANKLAAADMAEENFSPL